MQNGEYKMRDDVEAFGVGLDLSRRSTAILRFGHLRDKDRFAIPQIFLKKVLILVDKGAIM